MLEYHRNRLVVGGTPLAFYRHLHASHQDIQNRIWLTGISSTSYAAEGHHQPLEIYGRNHDRALPFGGRTIKKEGTLN